MTTLFPARRKLILIGLLAALLRPVAASGPMDDAFEPARNRMVDEAIVAAGVTNPRVVQAMRSTPRHEFVPVDQRGLAYFDMALPIGNKQTISPPFIVAFMTEQLDPQPTDRVLEIGTGSGYQAAVLSPLVRDVYTIEIAEPLGRQAAAVLGKLGYANIHTKIGDGYQGWPEHAPFDKIIVTCSPEDIPSALVEQLREGGRMVIPVGQRYRQNLSLLKKVNGKMEVEAVRPTFFVPMTGRAEQSRRVLPDPANPRIDNGDFEESVDATGKPAGWYYTRQLDVVSGSDAPSGAKYVQFSNSEPGRNSQALQAFAADGRIIRRLELCFHVRGEHILPGQSLAQPPMAVVTFYDEARAVAGEQIIGSWQGTFGWRKETATLVVPPDSREAVIAIGLLGAVGRIAFDGMEIKASLADEAKTSTSQRPGQTSRKAAAAAD